MRSREAVLPWVRKPQARAVATATASVGVADISRGPAAIRRALRVAAPNQRSRRSRHVVVRDPRSSQGGDCPLLVWAAMLPAFAAHTGPFLCG